MRVNADEEEEGRYEIDEEGEKEEESTNSLLFMVADMKSVTR